MATLGERVTALEQSRQELVTKADLQDLIVTLVSRFDRLEAKVATLDVLFDMLNSKIDEVEQRLSARMDRLETKVDDLGAKIDVVADRLESSILGAVQALQRGPDVTY